MTSKLRWGILGTGAIAKALARALPQSRTGELVAVGSRSQQSADKFAAEWGGERGLRAHASYEALLADEQVDVVYISTPHPMHAKWAIRAAEAGKHILCEKPLGVNHAEAMAMLDAAAEHGVFFMEAFMYRCHPQTARLIELIREGAVGEVRLIEASFGFQSGFNPEARTYNNDMAGGGIMDVGCYPVSMARLIAGVAQGQPFANPTKVGGAAYLGETGVDHWAAATLQFTGGIVAQVSTGVGQNLANVVRVFGSKGRLEVPNPWTHNRMAGGQFEILLHLPKADGPERVTIETDRTAYAYEVDVVGQAVAAAQKQPDSPAMNWADSLGNIQTLDQWRDAVGLTFNLEKPERQTAPLHGRPLAQRADAPIPHGTLPGIDKPMSRLVMGVDNQRHAPHAMVMFDAFFEQGGTVFDTAHIYGRGVPERLLGQWIKSRGVRDQIVLIAKGAHTPNCDPDNLTKQLDESFERLGVDYVDVYCMHRDNLDLPVSAFIDVLNEHHKAGRIGVFGGSNWSLARVEEANAYASQHNLQGFGVLSNNFSLARMVNPVWAGCIAASDADSRAWLEKTQMPLLPWSSQARGFFTDRAGPDKVEDRELAVPWYSEDNFERRKRAYELAGKKGVLPINIALAYVLAQPFPTFPLIGPRTLEELRTSLPGLTVTLTADEVKWLNLED